MNPAREFETISNILNEALHQQNRAQSDQLIVSAIERIAKLSRVIAAMPAKLGQKGGRKTAERGPEYFAQIAAMRKEHKGGRPRKTV